MAGEKFLHGNQALGTIKIGKKKGKGKGEGEGDGERGAMDERMKGPRYKNGLPRAKKNVVTFKPGVVLRKPEPANPPSVLNNTPASCQEPPVNWAAKAKEGTSAALRQEYGSEDGYSESTNTPPPVLDFGIAPFPRKGTNTRHASSDSSVSQEMLVEQSPPKQYQYTMDDHPCAQPLSPPPGFSPLPHTRQRPSPYCAIVSPGRENQQPVQNDTYDPWNKPSSHTPVRASMINPPPGFGPKSPAASPQAVPSILQRFDRGLARQLDALTRARRRAEGSSPTGGSHDFPYGPQ